MKKLIIALFAVLLSTPTFAQFEEGKPYIATSLSGLGLNYSSNTHWTFGLDAVAGYFLFEDIMVLGKLNYAHNSASDDLFAGVGARYYIRQNGLHLGANVGYKYAFRGYKTSDYINKKSDRYNHDLLVGPEIGYTFFLNQHVTIEPAIYYNMSINDFSHGSEVGLRIGFGFFFDAPKKNK